MREDGVDVIFVSDSLSDSARSFVCGHELGHYIYDRGLNRPFLDRYTCYIPNKYENRADSFSAQLLWGKLPMYRDQGIFAELATKVFAKKTVANHRIVLNQIFKYAQTEYNFYYNPVDIVSVPKGLPQKKTPGA